MADKDSEKTLQVMRILYLSPCAQLGGAEKSLLDLLASMRAAKPDWPLHLAVSEDGPLVSLSVALGVPTTVLPFPSVLAGIGDAAMGGPAGHQRSRLSVLVALLRAAPAVMAYVRKLRRLIRNSAPDLIHSNGFKMHVLGLWSKPARVPIVWHIHDYVSARPIMARLLQRYARRCAAAVANSNSVAEDLKAVFGPKLPVATVYNGVDLETFSPDGPVLDLDQLAGLDAAAPHTIRVGLLATLARWKGHETFLRALARIPADISVRGYVVGGALYQTSGSQHSLTELKQMAHNLGLEKSVGFVGFVAEPAAAMRALDIVIHASTEPEPFGLVIAEGMACGRAVIVSEAGGAAELITQEADALSHTPGDAVMLARCMTRLAADSRLRMRLGEAGRRTAIARFDRARLASELIPLYDNVCSPRSLVEDWGSKAGSQQAESSSLS